MTSIGKAIFDRPASPPTTAQELTERLEAEIRAGRLPPDSRLEPVRSAAEALSMAPNTVAAAYRALQQRGLVRSEGRRGTFVAAGPSRAAGRELDIPEGVVDLANGNPDPALLPPIGPALAGIDTATAMYGAPQVDAGLARKLMADAEPDLTRLSIGDEPAVVGGALDGIERALGAHLRPGDRVAIEDPGYPSVLDLITAMGYVPVPMAIDERGPLPDAADAACAGAAAAVITPRAQNPTGAAIDAERAEDLASVFARHPSVMVVEDDHAGPVAGTGYHSSIPADAPRWAVVRSMAKSLGPDLRVAALFGDELTSARVSGRQILGTGWVSHLLQRLVLALLTDPATSTMMADAADVYQTRRRRFTARLATHGVDSAWSSCPSGLNVWVPVDDEAHVVAGMQHAGYAIRSGSRFRQRSAPAIRVSVAGASDDVLIDAADALGAVLTDRRSTRSV